MSTATNFAVDRGLFNLDGRVAVVTGAAGGLGRVFAEALGAFGATVWCTDIDLAGAEQTAELTIAAGGNAQALQVDAADEQSLDQLAAAIKAAGGRCDVLINNAGIATPKYRIHEMPVDDWDRLMAINLRGVFLCTRALLPFMLAQQSGSVINVSSIAGLVGVSPQIPAVSANYSASKGGLIALTRQGAAEYGGDGIRFNAICPGWHLGTQLGREEVTVQTPEMIEAFLSKLNQLTPMGRTGEPAELAGLVVFLASDAASFLTGQAIANDGGWSAV